MLCGVLLMLCDLLFVFCNVCCHMQE